MDQNILVFFSSLPLIIITTLLVVFRWPARHVMPIGFLTTVAIAWSVWAVPENVLYASIIQGEVITIDILIIVFGALVLINILKYSGSLDIIRNTFMSLSEDFRVQMIIVSWLFGSFLEGAAGFGTPAAIVAPLLVSIGYPVGAALLAGMMTMSTAVTFGAIGTPILLGVKGGLKLSDANTLVDGTDVSLFIDQVTLQTGLLHACIGTFMPLVMVMVISRFYSKEKGWRVSLDILPFLLFAGFAFTIPYALTAAYLGPEFPSLIGAGTGLIIVIWFVRKGWLQPGNVIRFSDTNEDFTKKKMPSAKQIILSWLPYALVAILLVISRIEAFGFGSLLKSLHIRFNDIFESGIAISSTPLYLPGTVMLFVSILVVLIFKMESANAKAAFYNAGQGLFSAALVLIFTLPMVRIFINSDINENGYSSMPVFIAQEIGVIAGDAWLIIAPFVGAFGAFIAGSNTISNLTFTEFQYNIATELNFDPVLIVSMQAIGAAAGNMIAIHNIVAASATVGMVGKEGWVIRRTIIPTMYYILALIIIVQVFSVLGILVSR